MATKVNVLSMWKKVKTTPLDPMFTAKYGAPKPTSAREAYPVLISIETGSLPVATTTASATATASAPVKTASAPVKTVAKATTTAGQTTATAGNTAPTAKKLPKK